MHTYRFWGLEIPYLSQTLVAQTEFGRSFVWHWAYRFPNCFYIQLSMNPLLLYCISICLSLILLEVKNLRIWNQDTFLEKKKKKSFGSFWIYIQSSNGSGFESTLKWGSAAAFIYISKFIISIQVNSYIWWKKEKSFLLLEVFE